MNDVQNDSLEELVEAFSASAHRLHAHLLEFPEKFGHKKSYETNQVLVQAMRNCAPLLRSAERLSGWNFHSMLREDDLRDADDVDGTS